MDRTCGLGHVLPMGVALCPTCGMGAMPTPVSQTPDANTPGNDDRPAAEPSLRSAPAASSSAPLDSNSDAPPGPSPSSASARLFPGGPRAILAASAVGFVVVMVFIAVLDAVSPVRSTPTYATPIHKTFTVYYNTCIKNGWDDATCTQAASDGVNGVTTQFAPQACPVSNCSSIDGHNSGSADSSNPAYNGYYNACMDATSTQYTTGDEAACRQKAAQQIVAARDTGVADFNNPEYSADYNACMDATSTQYTTGDQIGCSQKAAKQIVGDRDTGVADDSNPAYSAYYNACMTSAHDENQCKQVAAQTVTQPTPGPSAHGATNP